jgi:Cd2+/Zn2+-exporting ATPase
MLPVIIRIALSAVITIVMLILEKTGVISVPESWAGINSASDIAVVAVFLVSYLIIGYDLLAKAVKNIARGQFLDEIFLMAVASVGAMALCEFTEGTAVMIFFRIGELFEDYAVGKSKKNIEALMDIRPDYANIEENGQLRRVAPDSVETGSIIVIQPGEKVPIDGIVVSGTSSLNTAALTGESLPVEVGENDEVLSGSVNMTGVLHLKTTTEFGESTISRILKLVRESGEKKTPTENFIKKFARFYTPIVCGLALALALLGPSVTLLFGLSGANAGEVWMDWIYRALTFLVVSCPCALVISIPLSFFAGIGCESRNGVLVKGSGYIDALSKTKTVVFDKTGTMTKGVFEVVGIHHCHIQEEKLLELAAYAESSSSHPIAKSLLKAYGKEIDRTLVESIEEIGGNGIVATIGQPGIARGVKVRVAVGNDRLMKKLGISFIPCHSTGTIVHVAIDGEYSGHILITDILRPTAKKAIRDLKLTGVEKTVMLTGDSEGVAKTVAKELMIDETHAGLLPADKVAKIEEILDKKQAPHDTIVFVGDGINDAPVLSRADVGIAMGGLGSDAAIEAADIVLMDDDPAKIALAIKIARKAMRIVYENIFGAIGIKVLCLLISALGILGTYAMWLAIFADTGVLVLAVLNSMRALSFRDRSSVKEG